MQAHFDVKILCISFPCRYLGLAVFIHIVNDFNVGAWNSFFLSTTNDIRIIYIQIQESHVIAFLCGPFICLGVCQFVCHFLALFSFSSFLGSCTLWLLLRMEEFAFRAAGG